MSLDLWVDFNDLDEHQQVHAPLQFAASDLKVDELYVGRIVTVGDDEGNRAKAAVLAIEKSFVRLVVDSGTFEPAADADLTDRTA